MCTISSLFIRDVILWKTLRPVRRREGHGVGQLRGEVLTTCSGGRSLLMERRLLLISKRNCPLLADSLHLLLLQVCAAGKTQARQEFSVQAWTWPRWELKLRKCIGHRTIMNFQDSWAGNCAEGVEDHTFKQARIFRKGFCDHQGAQFLCRKQQKINTACRNTL